MKTKSFFFASIVIAGAAVFTADVAAQDCSDGINCGKYGKFQAFPIRAKKMLSSVGHPHPVYAHSRGGITATRTHRWNQAQAQQHSWHQGYYHPQYGQPLALVVPPTASFQSSYSWGVGNTRSMPIYHQYGRPYPGTAVGAHPGMYQPTPSQPWSTDQSGVYYSRAPW